MSASLEPPDAAKHSWEANSFNVDTGDDASSDGDSKELAPDYAKLLPWREIAASWHRVPEPLPDPAVELERKLAEQKLTLQNVSHQADLRLRKLVSACMIDSNALRGTTKQALAKKLNEAKRVLLAEMKDPKSAACTAIASLSLTASPRTDEAAGSSSSSSAPAADGNASVLEHICNAVDALFRERVGLSPSRSASSSDRMASDV